MTAPGDGNQEIDAVLLDWFKKMLIEKYHTIEMRDLTIFTVVDDIQEAVDLVSKCFGNECWMGPPTPPMLDQVAKPTAEGTRTGVVPRHTHRKNPPKKNAD